MSTGVIVGTVAAANMAVILLFWVPIKLSTSRSRLLRRGQGSSIL
jgi:hypothetical protein